MGEITLSLVMLGHGSLTMIELSDSKESKQLFHCPQLVDGVSITDGTFGHIRKQ